MSRLSVAFQSIPGILSCGELFCTDATITNTGPCLINRLYLAVSDPKHVYLSLGETTLPEKNLCQLPLSETMDSKISVRVVSLPLPNNRLDSGESIKAKLWLHAPQTSGAFDVELLFYYDSENTTSSKARYRLLRHYSSIYLEKSLSLKVVSLLSQNLQKVITSQSDGESTSTLSANLVIEARNCSEVDTSCSSYTIVGVSTNSDKWAIMPHSILQEQQLQSGESCHLCLQCVPYQMKCDILAFSQLHFGSTQIPLQSWWRFTLRERISLSDLLADPPPPNPTADHVPPPPTQAQKDVANIVEADMLNMVVTVLWMGIRNDVKMWGQHSIYLKSLRDTVSVPNSPLIQTGDEEKPPVRIIPETPPSLIQSLLPSTALQKNLVKVSANFPDRITHDFHLNRLCSVKFELILQNCSACSLIAHLNLSPENVSSSNGNTSNHMYSPQSSTQLLFVGGTERKINLAPWEQSKVPISALVTQPGTYSLGTFCLTALRQNADPSEKPIPQICQLQSAVIVEGSSKGGRLNT